MNGNGGTGPKWLNWVLVAMALFGGIAGTWAWMITYIHGAVDDHETAGEHPIVRETYETKEAADIKFQEIRRILDEHSTRLNRIWEKLNE